MENKDFTQLNKKDKQIYKYANFIIFFLFAIFIILMLLKTIFPSQFFTFSFASVNSLRNTITDMNQNDSLINFYASTPLKFSNVKINLELTTPETSLENKEIAIQKSYKAFFYPETNSIENLENKEENSLVSVDDSVFIIGNKKKTPIDSTVTFESLGYSWSNLYLNNADLSSYEKQKLADLNAAHPDGTILKTSEKSNYYFIENATKKRVINPPIESIKNPIIVEEKSLITKEFCTLEKNILFKRRYSCVANLSQLDQLIGKDYRFTLNGLPTDIRVKKIDLEFKKSISMENFQFFLSELKKKILYRFGQGDE